MAVESISIDDDEFCFSLMPRLEESFGITFPHGFAELQTAGQLFDGVLALRTPDGTGMRCDSAMVFYRLRRAFARNNRGVRIGTSSPLSGLTDESPKALAKRLHRETGLRMPAVELSRAGCLISGSQPCSAPPQACAGRFRDAAAWQEPWGSRRSGPKGDSRSRSARRGCSARRRGGGDRTPSHCRSAYLCRRVCAGRGPRRTAGQPSAAPQNRAGR